MAYNRRQNPFEDEEDDRFEDITDDPEMMRIRQEKEFYQQRMVDSTHRSLQLVQESQAIAAETGADLHKQREQLERTNKNLDKISGDLNQTERHITSLKSIWGTVSTWFKKPLNPVEKSDDSSNSNIEEVTKINNGVHKGDMEIQNNLKKVNQKTDLSWDDGGYDSRYNGTSNDVVDNNLSNISAGLSILRQQGLALGKEIDDQNDLLGTIQGKVDTHHGKIENQTKNINKILR